MSGITKIIPKKTNVADYPKEIAKSDDNVSFYFMVWRWCGEEAVLRSDITGSGFSEAFKSLIPNGWVPASKTVV